MSPQMHSGRTAVRFCLGLAALSCVFAGIATLKAQAPVITNPGDLRTLTVNTAFRPGDPDPAWTVMAPMPTARAAFATAAANGKVYAIGGEVLNNCVTVRYSRSLRSGWGRLDYRICSTSTTTSFPAVRCHSRQHDLFGWRVDAGCFLRPHGLEYSSSIRSRNRQLVREAAHAVGSGPGWSWRRSA